MPAGRISAESADWRLGRLVAQNRAGHCSPPHRLGLLDDRGECWTRVQEQPLHPVLAPLLDAHSLVPLFPSLSAVSVCRRDAERPNMDRRCGRHGHGDGSYSVSHTNMLRWESNSRERGCVAHRCSFLFLFAVLSVSLLHSTMIGWIMRDDDIG